MMAISTRLESDTPSRMIFQRLLCLGHVVTERDYSTREVCHQLLDCGIMSASREFGVLCLGGNRRRQLRREELDDTSKAVEEQDMKSSQESPFGGAAVSCLEQDWFLLERGEQSESNSIRRTS